MTSIANTCPDCGNGFFGYKCGCGYKQPYKPRKADGSPEAPQSTNCTAHGCPMPGTISESQRPPHAWFCRFHFGKGSDKWQFITSKIHALTVADRHTKLSLPKERIDDDGLVSF